MYFKLGNLSLDRSSTPSRTTSVLTLPSREVKEPAPEPTESTRDRLRREQEEQQTEPVKTAPVKTPTIVATKPAPTPEPAPEPEDTVAKKAVLSKQIKPDTEEEQTRTEPGATLSSSTKTSDRKTKAPSTRSGPTGPSQGVPNQEPDPFVPLSPYVPTPTQTKKTSVPTWVYLAGGGVLLYLLMKK